MIVDGAEKRFAQQMNVVYFYEDSALGHPDMVKMQERLLATTGDERPEIIAE